MRRFLAVNPGGCSVPVFPFIQHPAEPVDRSNDPVGSA
jgi:hypothetical protein